MMSDNASSDPYPSPSSFFWGDAPGNNKCPRAPVPGPKIPLIKPDDLVLPPPQKRVNSHSGEIRMLSEPMPLYLHSSQSASSPTGAGSSAQSEFDFEDSSISSAGLESFTRGSTDFNFVTASSPIFGSSGSRLMNRSAEIRPSHLAPSRGMMMAPTSGNFGTPASSTGGGRINSFDMTATEKEFFYQMGGNGEEYNNGIIDENGMDNMSVDDDQGATTIFQMIVESSTMDTS